MHAARASNWARNIGALLLGALAITLVASPGASAPASSAERAATPVEFISILGNRGLEVIRSAASVSEKATYFREMLRQDFDLPDMCRFVLGRYWRIASHHQRREFRHLFEEDLLHFYGARLSQYGGEGFQVTGSRTDPAGLVVTSRIVRLQGTPIELDWRLRLRDGFYRVSDVVVDGVSMAVTQRSEFAAIIERNGGQIDGLLATIRGRI
jgi:phospholipid transport system substrate-binding protein